MELNILLSFVFIGTGVKGGRKRSRWVGSEIASAGAVSISLCYPASKQDTKKKLTFY